MGERSCRCGTVGRLALRGVKSAGIAKLDVSAEALDWQGPLPDQASPDELVVHIMTDTAITGSTYGLDGGQQGVS
jgi:hypothetical protein